jgi:hypothetical protein
LPETSNILFALNICRQRGMTQKLIRGVQVCQHLLCVQGQHAALKVLLGDALQAARQKDQPVDLALMLLRASEFESEYEVISKLKICRERRSFTPQESQGHAKSLVSCATCRTCRQDESHIARI